MQDLEVLRAYRCAMKEMEVLQRQLARIGSSGAPRQAGRRREDQPRGTNHAAAAQIQLYDGLRQQLERKRAEAESIGLRFEAILAGIGDQRLRLIIRSYYAVGMTDEQIGLAIDMSTRRVNMLRNGFLRSLELPEAA